MFAIIAIGFVYHFCFRLSSDERFVIIYVLLLTLVFIELRRIFPNDRAFDSFLFELVSHIDE